MSAATRTMSPWGFWGFIVLMLALTGLFVTLGTWQVQRLQDKEHLIAAVAARLDGPAQPFPSPALSLAEIEPYDFAPVSLTGHYLPDQSVLVFTSLSEKANGPFKGPGYWVVTPFALETGGTVFVNRGFVPQGRETEFLTDPAISDTIVTITGIARRAEETGSFTPAPDPGKRVEWVRNPDRLAAMVPNAPKPVSQLYVDLRAGAPGQLPQGGETVVEFPNRHLEYAGTWFIFALITPIMLGVWVWRQRRGK